MSHQGWTGELPPGAAGAGEDRPPGTVHRDVGALFRERQAELVHLAGFTASVLTAVMVMNSPGAAHTAYAGRTVTVKFTGTETDTNGGTTDFVIDDTALNVT